MSLRSFLLKKENVMASKSPKKSIKRSLAKIPTRREYKEFSVAHQNVLLERMEKQFAVFGEGQTILREKVESLETEFKTEISGLRSEVRGVKLEVRDVKERLERVEEIVIEILERLKGLESRVAALEAKWEIAFPSGSLPFPQNTEERFQQLEQRVTLLEAHEA